MAVTQKVLDFNNVVASMASHRHAAKAESIFLDSRPEADLVLLISLLRTLAIQRPNLLGHGDRTASYALVLGRAIGFQAGDLIHLHYAALLHDIGQLTLPAELLEKNDQLTAEEYELVESHPRAGAQLLEPVSFLRIPALWIAHHHERWDGSGYPYGLRDTFIPLGSRILAVADTFDAMTSRMADRSCLDPTSVFAMLQILAGSQLDPELVEEFLRLAPEPLVSNRARRPAMVDERRVVPPASEEGVP